MTMHNAGTWYSDPSHFSRSTRREILFAGWLGGLGLTLGDFLKLQANGAEPGGKKIEPKAKSVIHIYLQGGFAHMDSFDPKPDAPPEYRGILSAIDTSLPGVQFSSHMQETAKIADKLTIVRSMTHTEVDHSRGEHSMFTGYRPSPALVYPSVGSVVAHELGPRGAMPPYVCVPTQGSQFLGSGYLSNACGPFALGTDPSRPNFTVRDLSMPAGVDERRFEERKSWKQLVDQHFTSRDSDDSLATMVQVRETNFEGDEYSRYALHLGTFPRPAALFPAGGSAGESVSVRFLGDALGEWDHAMQLPRDVRGDFPLYVTQDGSIAPTANPFRISGYANELENEPNNALSTQSRKCTLPIAFNGILQEDGDVDLFAFELTRGHAFQFEVFAARIGSPIDAVLSVLDKDGNVLVSSDDDETHDSRLVFAPLASGTYAIRIADKRGAGGERCIYRIEAAPLEPKLHAFLPRPNRLSQEGQTISVPKGNRVAARLAVQRTYLEGEVQLKIDGLPSRVSASPASISADRYWVPVIFSADADAPLAGSLSKVIGTTQTPARTVTGNFLQVVDLVAGPADALFHSVSVDRLAVAVVEEAPFSIALEKPQAALAQDGTIGLRVTVSRKDDFDGPVDVSLPFLPSWVDAPAKITVPAGESSAVYPLRAHPEAESRSWVICVEAKAGTAAPRTAIASGYR